MIDQLIMEEGKVDALHGLRRRRNAPVHVNPSAPALTFERLAEDRAMLEQDAKNAVEHMYDVMELSIWHGGFP